MPDIREQTFALIESNDSSPGWSTAAGIQHVRDAGSWPGENGLDRAVTPVAHPAFESAIKRHALDEGAVTDALDAAADEHVAHDVHPTSPVSLVRAPRQRDGAQRAIERT
jgi:hypothetical protein